MTTAETARSTRPAATSSPSSTTTSSWSPTGWRSSSPRSRGSAPPVGVVGGEVVPSFPTACPTGSRAPTGRWSSGGTRTPAAGPGADGRQLRLPEVGVRALRQVRHASRPQGGRALWRRRQRDDPAGPRRRPRGVVRARGAGSSTRFRPAGSRCATRCGTRSTRPAHASSTACASCASRAARPSRSWHPAPSAAPLKLAGFLVLGGACSVVFSRGRAKRALVRAWRCCGYLYQIARSAVGKV